MDSYSSVFEFVFVNMMSLQLNALLDTMTPEVARGAIKDFGGKLVKLAGPEIMAHLSASDIDAMTSSILETASTKFLDAALAMRLRTIDAKPLINALARAERLGYEPDDIVEEPASGQERVIPQQVPQFPAPAVAPPIAPKAMNQCGMCNRLFDKEPPFFYVSFVRVF